QDQAGDTLSIYGAGFDPSPGQDTVTINGVLATVVSASATKLTVLIPAGATSGYVLVTTAHGTAQSPQPITVIGPVAPFTVSPATATLYVDQRQAFAATLATGAAATVVWRVNSIPGGDSAVGTVSASGLYTAPDVVPYTPSGTALAPFTVTATSATNPTVSASATVNVLPPRPVYFASRMVSVLIEPAFTGVAVTPPISVAFAPVITAVSPASAPAGSSLTLTVTGQALTGATTLTILGPGGPDAAFTVTNLVVNGGGTQATATVVIGPGAAPGDRALAIQTPSGTSTLNGTGGNRFTVP
ncbi:MAG: IPT/TIG domain-containing protein, partial [Candidatus Rokubacteria bacterium]|nr:IPT/TIG domain-containing protein [Candidatus Rokubacteria bacterium]